MAMAMSDSVTVSMGEEIRGVFRVIFRVRAEVRSYKGGGEGSVWSSARQLPLPVLSQAKLEGAPPPSSLAEETGLMLREEDLKRGWGGGDLGLS